LDDENMLYLGKGGRGVNILEDFKGINKLLKTLDS